MRKTRWGLFIVAMVPLLFGFDGVSYQEVVCDEATLRISDCCGARATYLNSLSCNINRGCNPGQNPRIPEKEAVCIRGLTCEELIDGGLCDSYDQRTVCP